MAELTGSRDRDRGPTAHRRESMTEPPAEPVLLEETSGNVRILTLNRPAKKNALSGDLVRRHHRPASLRPRPTTTSGWSDSPARGRLLLRCGPDGSPSPRPAISASPEGMADQVVRLVSGIRVECEKPVVAGIGGIAIGAGLALAHVRRHANRQREGARPPGLRARGKLTRLRALLDPAPGDRARARDALPARAEDARCRRGARPRPGGRGGSR